jgi:hypothetical protein
MQKENAGSNRGVRVAVLVGHEASVEDRIYAALVAVQNPMHSFFLDVQVVLGVLVFAPRALNLLGWFRARRWR